MKFDRQPIIGPTLKRYRAWLEEARSPKQNAKWRPIKDGIVRLRYVRVMMTTEP